MATGAGQFQDQGQERQRDQWQGDQGGQSEIELQVLYPVDLVHEGIVGPGLQLPPAAPCDWR